jgi:mannan endo-1,4-beta-mannosidase
MKKAGIKVLRTWVRYLHLHFKDCCSHCSQGFNAINGTEVAAAKKSGLTYYQVWNSSEWQLNTGPQGLQRLDNVIKTAGKYDIKVR